MLAADPTIRLLACGGLHLGVEAEWNRRLCRETDAAADCQTHHILEGGSVDDSADPAELFHAFMGYPIHVGGEYRAMRQRMLEAGIARPRLAITELQLFASYEGKRAGRPAGPPIPTPSTISESLYLMLIVHECVRLGDLVEMITHSATVNHGGGLRKHRERVYANPVHYAHVMGSALAGGTPLGVRLKSGTFSTSRTFGHLPVVADAPDLDALAVLAGDGRSLVLMLVHRSANAGPIELDIDLGGLPGGPEARVLTLRGETFTDQNTFEEPERIIPRPSSAAFENGAMTLTLPPFSLTRVDVPLAGAGTQ
jgi:alpha-N-arabinofuranosidase